MTSDERYETLGRMLEMQHSLRIVAEAAELQARLAKDTGADGLAFAIHMLRESVLVYSSELSKWVTEYIGEE
jgi:propanediol dehydratase small subunit